MNNEFKKKLEAAALVGTIGVTVPAIANQIIEDQKTGNPMNNKIMEDSNYSGNNFENFRDYNLSFDNQQPQESITPEYNYQYNQSQQNQTINKPEGIYFDQAPMDSFFQPTYTTINPQTTTINPQTTTMNTQTTTMNPQTTTINQQTTTINQQTTTMNPQTTITQPTTTQSLKELYPNLPIQENPNYSQEELMTFYGAYALMQDAVGFRALNTSEGTLTEQIEKQFNCKLSAEDKKRYDTLLERTRSLYEIGIKAYELGEMEIFIDVYNKISKDKSYMHLDDLVKIMSLNINNRNEMIINNPTNYQIVDGKLNIDGVIIENMMPFNQDEGIDFNNVMSLINFYSISENQQDELDVLNILQIPKFIKQELTNPTSFSLCVNGTYYSYNDKELGDRINNRALYLSNQLGLTRLGYEILPNATRPSEKYLFYGYDAQGNKQYIDQNTNYSNSLYQLMIEIYPRYNKSVGTGIGYFDGGFMQGFLKQWEDEEKALQNNQPRL